MFCPASYALSQATSTFATTAQQPRRFASKKRKPHGDVVVLVHGLAVNEYSMVELVRSVTSTVEPLGAEKNLALNVSLPADLPIGRGNERDKW